MTDAEQRAEHFRRSENSFLLEGMDASKDELYQKLKRRVIDGDMDISDMRCELVEEAKSKIRARQSQYALTD